MESFELFNLQIPDSKLRLMSSIIGLTSVIGPAGEYRLTHYSVPSWMVAAVAFWR